MAGRNLTFFQGLRFLQFHLFFLINDLISNRQTPLSRSCMVAWWGFTNTNEVNHIALLYKLYNLFNPFNLSNKMALVFP